MNHAIRHVLRALLLLILLAALPASAFAETRFIVRDQLGASAIQSVCLLLGCQVSGTLDGTVGQLFLVTTSTGVNPRTFINLLLGQLGVVDAEVDQLAMLRQSSSGGAPPALYDNAQVNYFGTTVINGYVSQPATQLIRLADAQNGFAVRGAGTVAVIDTGVDPTHPVLQPVLVPGYDFTRNQAGLPDEKADLNQSTVAVVDGQQPAIVNQSTVAVVDQSTVAVVDQQQYAAFGHGTMVSGVIHLVAPGASIMPLKAFHADGSGYLSDVMRAVYYAVQHSARVINMSFSVTDPSPELEHATVYAKHNNVVSVASAGNDGQETLVYPAAYQCSVMGVASTDNSDQRSTFSNYGSALVWVAAPGEGVVTTYPWGTWAAAWGTSFSTPFVAGTVALLLDAGGSLSQSSASQAISHAQPETPDLNYGRLDIYQALTAWRQVFP